MSEPTILTELHPSAVLLCQLWYNGMGDPLYAISCRGIHWATDLDLPWSTGAGDGFYAYLTRAEIYALRRAGERFPGSISDDDRSPPDASEMNDVEEAEQAADFFAGIDCGDGAWPEGTLDIGDDGEPELTTPSSLFRHPTLGLMLLGDEARRQLERKLNNP